MNTFRRKGSSASLSMRNRGTPPRRQAISTTHRYHLSDRLRAICSRKAVSRPEFASTIRSIENLRMRNIEGASQDLAQRRCSLAVPVVVGKRGGQRGRSTRASVRHRASSEGWRQKGCVEDRWGCSFDSCFIFCEVAAD